MPKKTRKRPSVQEKATILRLHLLERTPVSDLCDEYGIHPTMSYRWQKELFENAAAALDPRTRRPSDAKDRRIRPPGAKAPTQERSPLRTDGGAYELKKELGEL